MGINSLTGSNSALDTALTLWVPSISMVTVTSTSTTLDDQLGSGEQTQRTTVAPCSLASLSASSAGEPVAPKGRKVTGAAASAAASAAATARPRPAETTPPAATAVQRSASSTCDHGGDDRHRTLLATHRSTLIAARERSSTEMPPRTGRRSW